MEAGSTRPRLPAWPPSNRAHLLAGARAARQQLAAQPGREARLQRRQPADEKQGVKKLLFIALHLILLLGDCQLHGSILLFASRRAATSRQRRLQLQLRASAGTTAAYASSGAVAGAHHLLRRLLLRRRRVSRGRLAAYCLLQKLVDGREESAHDAPTTAAAGLGCCCRRVMCSACLLVMLAVGVVLGLRVGRMRRPQRRASGRPGPPASMTAGDLLPIQCACVQSNNGLQLELALGPLINPHHPRHADTHLLVLLVLQIRPWHACGLPIIVPGPL